MVLGGDIVKRLGSAVSAKSAGALEKDTRPFVLFLNPRLQPRLIFLAI